MIDQITPIIHDGDHGGDDFIASIIAALDHKISLLAVTTTAGNTSALQAAKNACQALSLAECEGVPVYAGSLHPYGNMKKQGDDAFGGDGLCGVMFPRAMKLPEDTHALDAMADIIQNSKTAVTICITGPCTNLANFLDKYPELEKKIDKVVIMGGGFNPSGNIKPYAEFNAYMDPHAMDRVLRSHLEIYLHTLDTTHLLTFNRSRKNQLFQSLSISYKDKIISLMGALEELEFKTFGSDGAFMHDQHTILSQIMPNAFRYQPVEVSIDLEKNIGQLLKNEKAGRIVNLCTKIDADQLYAKICENLAKLQG